MPFRSLKLIPGLNSQLSPTLNEMGWTAGPDPNNSGLPLSNLVRFPANNNGFPEVIGGWKNLTSVTNAGPIRALKAWQTLPGTFTAGISTPLLAWGQLIAGVNSATVFVNYSSLIFIGFIAAVGGSFPGTWFLDNWGENLLMVLRTGYTPVGSGIYQWFPSTPSTLLAPLANGPPACNGLIVAAPNQQVIAWGTPVPGTSAWGTTQDPMLIAWSDISINTSWFASPTNAAGSFRLTQGSQIYQIVAAQGQMLVHTDWALYGMQFIGAPFYYGFQQLGSNCGSISPHAATTIGGQSYWWGSNGNFYTYNGVVVPLSCPIRSLCLDIVQPNSVSAAVVNASTNSRYSEVRWDFAANGSDCDSYVSYNVLNQTWSYGTTLRGGQLVGRTAMTDFLPTLGAPVGGDVNGFIWQHESDGAVRDSGGNILGGLPWSLTSGYSDIADGEQFVFIDGIYPDAVQTGGNIGIRVYTADYPETAPRITPPISSPPFAAGSGIGEIPMRQRGRQVAVQFLNTANTAPLSWRLGKVRLRVATDGRR